MARKKRKNVFIKLLEICSDMIGFKINQIVLSHLNCWKKSLPVVFTSVTYTGLTLSYCIQSSYNHSSTCSTYHNQFLRKVAINLRHTDTPICLTCPCRTWICSSECSLYISQSFQLDQLVKHCRHTGNTLKTSYHQNTIAKSWVGRQGQNCHRCVVCEDLFDEDCFHIALIPNIICLHPQFDPE